MNKQGLSKQGLNKQQLKWASQHDWFVKESFEGYVVVRDYDSAGNLELKTFKDFQELRSWAGY